MTIKNDILPTLTKLGATVPDNLDALAVAKEWFHSFSTHLQSGDVDAVMGLFVDDSFWRDILSLTWDFRTFRGSALIKQFLADRLKGSHIGSIKLREQFVMFQEAFPDVVWIQGLFDFETDVGVGLGIFRIVPTANGKWKAHALFTNLEELKGFPEKIGELRNMEPNHGLWAAERRREAEFEGTDPVVLVCGAGQSGLEVAARLKYAGISTLVVDRNQRIGDNWRLRYEALCLHDPVWYDHMPYIPFPATWPKYTPALKLADWLEQYANSLELNVWTSSTVVSAKQDPKSLKWEVVVRKGDQSERTFHVNHFIMALGIGDGVPNMPSIPGMDKFKGKILHSTSHKKAEDHAGEKVAVVGTCTSGHDIAADYYKHGVDITMIQRGPTYIMSTEKGFPHLMKGLYWEDGPLVDLADRFDASFPQALAEGGFYQRKAYAIAEDDKELLDGLKKVGFKTYLGIDDSGIFTLAWSKAGGYYLDVGTSQLIIDGKIKIKSDGPIKEFDQRGAIFEDGSRFDADVFVFATGAGNLKGVIAKIVGQDVADKCNRIWGLNKEREIYGAWRDLGFKGLWYMAGNLARCRFHSKHLALQIKAMEEGVFGTRYSSADK